MAKTNRRTARRISRQTASHRHLTRRIAAAGVVTLGVVSIVAVALLNVFSNGNSPEPTSWSVAQYSGGPRLAVDRTLIDEGLVPYNHEVNAIYRVKNVGDQPLTFQTPTVDIMEGC